MKKISSVIGIMVCLFYSVICYGQNGRLSSLLQSFHSMSANFNQTSTDNSGKLLKKSSGSMDLQRPGKFRWSIQTPSNQLIVADGTYLWIYDADLEQVTKQKLNASNTTNPASLLSGDAAAIQQRFNVKDVGNDSFELTPKGKNDILQSARLNFKNNVLNQMIVVDNLGQVTTFNFTQTQINPNLSPSIFVFSPPKGVDIIVQ